VKSDRDGWPIPPEGGGQAQKFSSGKTTVFYKDRPVEFCVELAGIETGQPVLDATNLKGTYEVRLRYVTRMKMSPELIARFPEWAPHSGADAGGEDVIGAFRHQLGLELKPDNVPFWILIVDHADRVPSPN
jgi:uncharacterized protein (TIGR03435 family)